MSIKNRLLKITDLKSKSGFWETLANLTPNKKVNYFQAIKAYCKIKKQNGFTYVAIDSETNKIVGTAKLLVEQKFIRGLSLAGHIEEVATKKGYEGQGIASQLVNLALKKADELGCYKIILDCRPELVNFYEKFGFEVAGSQMKIYLNNKIEK